jgi:hypothetical protein
VKKQHDAEEIIRGDPFMPAVNDSGFGRYQHRFDMGG